MSERTHERANPKLDTNSELYSLSCGCQSWCLNTGAEPVKKLISLDPIQVVKKTLPLPWFVTFASNCCPMGGPAA